MIATQNYPEIILAWFDVNWNEGGSFRASLRFLLSFGMR